MARQQGRSDAPTGTAQRSGHQRSDQPPRAQRLWRIGSRRVRSRLLGLWPVRRLVERRGLRMLYAIGDSHSRVLTRVSEQRLLRRTILDVEIVPGATALGLANPNSSTNALTRFRKALRRVPRDATLLVMLGEVDVGYLVWYRSQTRGTSVGQEFEGSLRSYADFLESLLAEGRRDLVLVTVPPPTVADYSTWAGLDNARKLVASTLRERTDLTRAYNARLRAFAADHGLRVLDYEDDVLDPLTGVVADRLRHPDPRNHHLDPKAFPLLIADRLRTLGFS